MYASTTYQPTAGTVEARPRHLRRAFRAVLGAVNEMNYGSERMIKRQAPWW
jgi:hypothetical protein